MLNHSSHLNTTFHALADPARRSMVERLGQGGATVSQLAQPLEMTLSAVMQHLAVLQEARIVSSAKSGRVRTFRLEPAALQEPEQWLQDRRSTWEGHFDRLEAFLDATRPPEETP